ncbi:MAG: endonuclease/exonuclease/phosphatase family protein, partial [Planctomycetota bacterium]
MAQLLRLVAVLAAIAFPPSSLVADPPTVTVETWNIRYDNPGDGPHAWRHRREGVIAHLRDGSPDVLGLQEVLPHQLAAIRKGLPGYDIFARGRERDGGTGEAVPILWRRDRWRLDEANATHFWLSETPENPGSMSWNTACTRMVTMIRLVSVEATPTLPAIWVCNLHLDHQSAKARAKGAALVRARLAARPEAMRHEPVVIVGDFNATPGSPPVETLLAAGADGAFIDAWATT